MSKTDDLVQEIADLKAYIKRLKRCIARWEKKFDLLLSATDKMDKALEDKNKRLRKTINRAITILPLAKIGYVIDELEQALKETK